MLLNAAFTLLAAHGILMVLLGLGIDFLPGGYPGLNLPQLLLIAAGLMLFLVSFALRAAHVRQQVWEKIRKYPKLGLVITVITLLALEFALVAADMPTSFPPALPETSFKRVPWWTCDKSGCHYVHDAIKAACESGELSNQSWLTKRHCMINRQGFHDTQDFTAGDDLDERTRILILGDSFAFGLSAEIGKSFVETIEARFPQSIVWNTGIVATGTKQALASFQVYAPVLQPQMTIYSFYVNDFYDNMFPVRNLIWVETEQSGAAIVRGWLYQDRYYTYPIEVPASEIERLIGTTRLGSLALRLIDVVEDVLFTDPCEAYFEFTERTDVCFERQVDVMSEVLQALRDSAAAQDTALLVLLIPHREEIPPPRLSLHQAAMQILKELEMPYLNPIHLLDTEFDYAPKPDDHWNSAGHQKIGTMLSDCIEAFQIRHDLSDCEQVEMP